MKKSFFTLIIGDLDEKRAYRNLMKRAKALPKEYAFAFKKMQHYIYNFSYPCCDISVFVNLIDLLENSATNGRPVSEVIGKDASKFCDELIEASSLTGKTSKEKLNQEIQEHFQKEAH